MNKGIDVSEYQGNIDLDRVKNDNIEFAILKFANIYDDENIYYDTKFERNYKNCRELNIPLGLYIYNYCNYIDNLEKNIKKILSKLSNIYFELPIFLDMEDDDILSEGKSYLSQMCKYFCKMISESSFIPGIYANLNWLENYLDISQFPEAKIWVAQYNSVCTYKKPYILWQYSNVGTVNGISGNVDMNYLYENNKIDYTLEWQKVMNKTYNCNLEEDGIFGPICKSMALKHYLYYKSPIISNTHVLFIQKLFNLQGYNLAKDSMFGPKCKEATISFQEKNNLTVDGCVGPEVTEVLLK